jgi:hypothetical protein
MCVHRNSAVRQILESGTIIPADIVLLRRVSNVDKKFGDPHCYGDYTFKTIDTTGGYATFHLQYHILKANKNIHARIFTADGFSDFFRISPDVPQCAISLSLLSII